MEKQNQRNVLLVTIAIFVATFMTAIEGTIVSTAMPTIISNLHGMRLMNWVFSIYLLTNAMMTPIYGKMADRIGRKPIFIFGLVLFVIGSTLCGLSNHMETLIISRAIQGIGAGAIMPVSFTIIADIYPIEKRAKVLGFNGSAWGIASIIAPLLGGFIVDKLTWHWIFFINVPIGIITIGLICYCLHEEKRSSKAPVDYWGSLWLMLALLGLLYGFQLLGETNASYELMALVLIGAVVAFGLFMRTEKRAEDPIIALDLFKNRTFVVQNAVAALVSGFLIGFEVYMPMWMQGILGLKASMGGFVVTPSSIMWIFASLWAGQLLVKHAPRTILTGSLLILLVGSFILALVPQSTPFWFFLVVAAGLGVGFGSIITTTTVTAQSVAGDDKVGVATSFNTLSRTLGQTLMVSIYGIIVNVQLAKGIANDPRLGSNMLNKLINPETAVELPKALLPVLRHILYNGLHHIYFASIILIIIALGINWLDHKKKA